MYDFFFAGTKDKKGTPGERGNPGYFAMKFVNLRNRNRQPTVLVIKHPYVQFKIDSMTCDLKKGVLKVDSNETEVVQHITLAFVTATLYLLVQPRPPVLPPHWDKPWEKRGPKAVIFFNYIFSELNVLYVMLYRIIYKILLIRLSYCVCIYALVITDPKIQ